MSDPISPPPSLELRPRPRPHLGSRSGGLAQLQPGPAFRSLVSVTNGLDVSRLQSAGDRTPTARQPPPPPRNPSVLQNEQSERAALPFAARDIEDTSGSQSVRRVIETQPRPAANSESFIVPENVTGIRELSRRMNPDLDTDGPSESTGPDRRTSDEAHLDEPEESDVLPETARLSLPVDDGMTRLRQRIHDIRDTEASTLEKARRIHEVMTESYYSSTTLYPRPESVADSLQNLDLSQTPGASQSEQSSDALPTSPSSPSAPTNSGSPYYLTQKDYIQTHYVKPVPTANQDDDILTAAGITSNDLADEDEVELGCVHYKRNIKLQCYTCKRWYTCRFCHDEVEDHALNRRQTENMLCMLCNSPQPASQWCDNCGTQAACYFCAICKLWDNNAEKSIYHCDECGICRIGQGIGKDFFHCKKCCACMPISIETTHRCIEESTKCDCPICGEYMFTSPSTVIFMRCGHSIHQKCFLEHSQSSYRCPICNKSVTNMETNFRNLDRTIESQPMPPEFRETKAVIHCNDCRAKSVVQYHWLGLKCEICESYNTIQRQLLNDSADRTPHAEERGGLQPNPNQRAVMGRAGGSESSALSQSYDGGLTGFAGQTQRSGFASRYRHSSGQSISPRVTNYFSLSRQENSDSYTQSHNRARSDSVDTGSFRFWGHINLKETLGLTSSSDANTHDDSVEEEDEEEDDSNDGTDDEDEDDDGIDGIDIFGHK